MSYHLWCQMWWQHSVLLDHTTFAVPCISVWHTVILNQLVAQHVFFFVFYVVFECKLLFKCRKDFDYVWKLISTVVFHHRTQSGCELNCLMLLVELMIKSSHVRSKNNTPSETGIGPQVNMLCMQTSSHFPYLWGHMFNFDLKFSSYTIYIVQTWKPTDRPSHLKFWH